MVHSVAIIWYVYIVLVYYLNIEHIIPARHFPELQANPTYIYSRVSSQHFNIPAMRHFPQLQANLNDIYLDSTLVRYEHACMQYSRVGSPNKAVWVRASKAIPLYKAVRFAWREWAKVNNRTIT